MPTVSILYFAGLRERVGCSTEPLDLPAVATPAAILDALSERHPHCREVFAHSRVAVDCDFLIGEARIRPGAEVAIIQPVSGG